jgi:hypothetical protein
MSSGSVASGENGGQSERSSVLQMGEKASRLFLLNEIFVPALLANYVTERFVF